MELRHKCAELALERDSAHEELEKLQKHSDRI